MPMIEVPLKSWTDYATLRRSKKFQKLADEALKLAKAEKVLKARRAELSADLYDILDGALDDGMKTVTYNGATLTKRAGGEGNRFDKKKLMQEPIECNECGAENHVTVDVIEKCTTKTERRPSVSVKLAGEESGDE